MKTINAADRRILPLLMQKIPHEGTVLHRSQYVLDLQINGKHILFHTLSRECVSLPSESKEMLTVGQINEDECHLIQHRFYVTDESDECGTYCTVMNILRAMKKEDRISTYTILPTTYCNARCFYCYELDYHFTSLDDVNTENLIRFIEETHTDKEILIRWFGGEPLVGKRRIHEICNALKEKGIAFRSFMVSNGSLFTTETVEEASRLWNLKTVQITLDGDEEEYNRRKNYFDNSVSPYQQVIAGMHRLLKAGIKIQIRINMDFRNEESVLSLADDLDREFADKTNIGVYVHPLFLEEISSRCNEIWQRCLEMESIFEEKGFRISQNRGINSIRTWFCIAHNPANAVIGADGRVFACEHCNEESLLGTMNGSLKERRKDIAVQDVREKCRHCPFLPDCTEFAECPDLVYDCKGVHLLKLQNTLEKLTEKTSSR